MLEFIFPGLKIEISHPYDGTISLMLSDTEWSKRMRAEHRNRPTAALQQSV